jgi:thiol:disulfide interchange protein/DsbC/DsbD-like thiol-disulfide interchange protein
MTYMRPMRLFGFLVPLGLALVSGAHAAPLQTPHVEAELVSAVRSIEPGKPFTVALRLKHDEHWHTYWKNPGDSGMATAIQWSLPAGFAAGPIEWPTPRRIPIPPLANFGYDGEIYLLTSVQPPADLAPGRAIALAARAEWLVCKDVCLPGGATFRLSLPVATGEAEADPRRGPLLAQARSKLPRPLTGWTADVSQTREGILVRLKPSRSGVRDLRQVAFFPEDDGIIENAAEQKLLRDGDGWVLRVTAAQGIGSRATVDGLLVAEPGWNEAMEGAAAQVSLPVAASAPELAPRPTTLLCAALLAFAGGLVLNLMPCVFPVVSIKVLGFVEQAQGDRRRLRLHGLAFGSGVVVCFWAVAGLLLLLRSSGAALGWGYQLQSPLLVTALAVLFFVLGLNLSGLFELGTRLQVLAGGVGGGHGYRGSFLTGLLATVVAAPCTAPFMGAALGYALTQPAGLSMLVFSALALGMAAPYVALSASPALIQRLPRPGRWMQTFKQLLAFPVYLTVVWLVWVLGKQQGLDGAVRLLAGLVLLAAGLWALGRWGVPSISVRGRVLARAAASVLAVTAVAVAWPGDSARARAPTPDPRWQPYSSAALRVAQASGRPVFVDFTAAWCVTCQVNKRLVLESEPVRRAFEQKQVMLMRADWTNRDADIAAALARLGRSGVPVYALYAQGAGASPRLLPEILTRDLVRGALDALPTPPG